MSLASSHDLSELLALGTPQLGMPYGVANSAGPPSPTETRRLLETARTEGIRYFDTAQAYGDAETVLGQHLAERQLDGAARIITKLHPEAQDASAAELEERLARSGARLGARQIWALLLHRDRMLDRWESEFGQTIRRWREQGSVRHLGFSVQSVDALPRALAVDDFDVFQVPANVFDRRLMRGGKLDAALKTGKRVFVRSVYLQGLALLDIDRVSSVLPSATPMVQALDRFCTEHGLHRRQFALDYIRRRLPGTTLVIGAISAEQLRETCDALRREPCDLELCDAWDWTWPTDDESIIDPGRWNVQAQEGVRT